MRCTALTKGYENDRVRRAGPRCKRTCADGTDFCKQHSPLNKMDDVTCAICLDEIQNPMKMAGCTHVYCKECIGKNIMHGHGLCPCCRTMISFNDLVTAISPLVDKTIIDTHKLEYDVTLYPWKWCKYEWTKAMRKQFFSVYSEDTDVEQWKLEVRTRFFDESGLLRRTVYGLS